MKFDHVVAMPYPGRGHINPMMNLCHLLASRLPNTLFTFIITEEWHTFIGSDPKPSNIRFATIPNILPSEIIRGANMPEFIDGVMNKMEQPFEDLLDRLEIPPKLIVADTFLAWAVRVGNRRNVPVASYWTMTASMFTVFYHFDLLVQNNHYPVQLSEKGEEIVDYIPGLSPTKIKDFPTIFFDPMQLLTKKAVDCFHLVHKTEFVLFTTVYELEAEAIDALKQVFKVPVYAFGPNIPYAKLELELGNPVITSNGNNGGGGAEYLKWLDSKPPGSVLYVSLGSFLSVSSAQMDEIAAGLKESGVNYLWVARGETTRLEEVCGGGGDQGLVVEWCDQLRVLSHSSLGGFWTHCGWNSVKEGIFAGVPMLTFPIMMDQVPNAKLIVEDWKNGWRVGKERPTTDRLVAKEEIGEIVRKFMDLESVERKGMMKKVNELKEICQSSVDEGGSAYLHIDAFVKDISKPMRGGSVVEQGLHKA